MGRPVSFSPLQLPNPSSAILLDRSSTYSAFSCRLRLSLLSPVQQALLDLKARELQNKRIPGGLVSFQEVLPLADIMVDLREGKEEGLEGWRGRQGAYDGARTGGREG